MSLQAVNLAGLARITEEALWFLATRCEGLLMLNLTGCERVTVVGLDHLIRGLNFVEKAVSFMGFKPVDEHGVISFSKRIIFHFISLIVLLILMHMIGL